MSFPSLSDKSRTRSPPTPAIVGPPKLPLDILETIVDQADRKSQLQLSLVSRCLMYRSRKRLFHTIVLTHGILDELYPNKDKEYDHDRRLDRLFKLLESPIETIASNVKTIHFGRVKWKPFEYRVRDNLHLLAMKLHSLKMLHLISIHWEDMPAHFLDFFIALSPQKVLLQCLSFERITSFVQLLQSPLITNAQELLFFDVHVKPSTENSTLLVTHNIEQALHFSIIDTSSLVNFCRLWDDDFMRTNVTIDTLSLQFATCHIETCEKETVIAFIKKVLLSTGPNPQSLSVDLGGYQCAFQAIQIVCKADFLKTHNQPHSTCMRRLAYLNVIQ
ncbi:hypothetical protein C0992_002834 [Termitomyces sp. T32_za158]|nr:hypothetical protein C0992_002834 [Termitomyces sp. T32_za158]